ncbi:MAG TPA: DMT family transporter [Bacteroidales bacterium]|jgi:drug/metabolite transporter (DMT)-like permease|nr:DMT family transporter [Bacteroidales bacterium]HOH83319.1 DMT family transporter [Bacteroidales bacterium]HPI29845.1 DMT family transporter [Bacteroidales bacterium]HQN15115.1 DMT family transporter [Bacteroidales bacterium]
MNLNKKNPSTVLLGWAILLVLVLVWGSSFILMKRGLEHYSHTQLALMRISIACIFLIPFAIFSIKKINRKKLGYIALVGIIGNGIPAFLFAKAQTGIDSSLAGILNSLTPLFTLIAGLLFFGYKARWINITGVFIGLAGTVGLMSISGNKTLDFNFRYGIYIMVATVLYAINLNIVKKYLEDTDPVTITAFAFLIIGIPALIVLFFFTDFVLVLTTQAGALEGLGYIAILGIFGSGLAVILHNKLIKTSGVLFAASVTYMIPVVAVLWGIADGEAFEPVYLFWIALILLGIFMVNRLEGKNKLPKTAKEIKTENKHT